MDSIIYQFKKLSTPSRADIMVKLVHVNNELLLQKILGIRVNDPVPNPQSEHPNTGIMNDNPSQQDGISGGINVPNNDPTIVGQLAEEVGNLNNRRHKYTNEMKEYAVRQYLEKNNFCKAALLVKEKYTLNANVDESSVREWVNSLKWCTKQEIDDTKKKKQIRDPQPKWPLLEAHLRDYLMSQRKKKIAVNFKMIQAESKEFMGQDFNATNGWWTRARKRLKIVMRVATHVIQKLCSKSGEDIQLYLAKIQQLKISNLAPSPVKVELLFGNFDEVPLLFDMVSGRTYDFQGKKEICIQTTTGIKMRVTILMSILSNGVILPPLFIFKSKKRIAKELDKKFSNEALIFSNAKGWINEDLLIVWLDRIWLNLNISPTQKPILVFDQCHAHTSAKIVEYLKKKHINYEVIPAGTTGYLQPLDVSINKPLKSHIKVRFDKWYTSYGSTQANTTPKGYRRPPSYENLIRWTLEALKDINQDIVSHSFKTTGIITSN